MGQKDGEKWIAAANLQPTIPKSDRLLASLPELHPRFAGLSLWLGTIRA
jgi:SulP family sulfate permease